MKAKAQSQMRVFVIWEPVLATDWGTPSPTLTAYVADPRGIIPLTQICILGYYWGTGR